MKPIRIDEIISGTQGRLICGNSDAEISHVYHDSRKVTPGSLFIAILGDSTDGHKYLDKAAENGCKAVLVSDADAAEVLRPLDISVILVDDTVKALQELSRWYLRERGIHRVAITGSTGKTSTKDMLYSVLSVKYKTIKTQGNFNNHLGVPLTIFQVEEDTEIGIFEMGMSDLNEIHLLADLVRPEVGLITNVGLSHMENLGSRENILKAKMEITDFMTTSDELIINSDNDKLNTVITEGKSYRLTTVGSDIEDSVRISKVVNLGKDGIRFTLNAGGEEQEFQIKALGVHNAWNCALAVTCGLHYGISLAEAAKGLEKLEFSGKRLNVIQANGIEIVDDTYNASPDSVKAGIDVLINLEGTRKVAILADMFELGDDADLFHYQMGTYAGEKEIHTVIAVGPRSRHIAEGAKVYIDKKEVHYFESLEILMEQLPNLIREGDVVLVKGSRGMEMDKAVVFLAEMRN